MASIAEEIVARMAAVIAGALPGVPIHRAREQPTLEAFHVRVDRGAESFSPMTNYEGRLRAALDVYVRVYGTGEPWESAADTNAVTVHAAIMADAPLKALVAEIRLNAIAPTPAGSPVDAGELAMHYAFQYLTRADALDLKPLHH